MTIRRRTIIISLVVGLVCVVAGWIVIASFGLLDSGKFEIVQAQTTAPNRIAILAMTDR